MLAFKHTPVRTGVAVVGVAMVIGGCASLDPTEDRDRAANLVETRAASTTGWDSPWNERPGLWDGSAPLTSDVAVRIALQNNREIRRQVETITAERADYVQAHLLPNPVLRLAVGFPTDGLGGTPLLATAVQQLAWLWRRPVMIDGAEADLRERVLAVSDDALRVVADVRRAHAHVVFAEQAVALQRENIALVDQSLELLAARFDVGEASRLDVNRLELDRLRAGTRLDDREATLAVSKRTLLELLGRAADGVEWSTDGVTPDAMRVTSALDETQLVHLASTQRLDVAAAAAARDGRAADVELAKRGSIPDVSVGVGYQQNYSNRPGVFPAVSITPKILDDNSARIAKAGSELHQAEIEADRVAQAAIAETRRAWVELLGQLDTVRAYRDDILGLAAQNYELAAVAFDAGETDLTVLLEAQRELNAARLELTDRQGTATDRLIELERAAGGSLTAQPPLDDALLASTPERENDNGQEVTP